MYRKLSFRGFVHIYTSSRLGGSPQKHVDIGFWAIFDQKNPSRRGDAPLFDPPVSFRTSWSQFWELSGWIKELKTCASDLFKTVEFEYKTTIEKNASPSKPGHHISRLPHLPPESHQNLTRISWTIKYSFGPPEVNFESWADGKKDWKRAHLIFQNPQSLKTKKCWKKSYNSLKVQLSTKKLKNEAFWPK